MVDRNFPICYNIHIQKQKEFEMSDARTEMFNRLETLAAQARNYRYAQAERNLAELRKFIDNAVVQKTQTQTQGA